MLLTDKYAEKIAQENGSKIEVIRKHHAFRKDDRIQEIISEKRATEGLVHIFSAVECCNSLDGVLMIIAPKKSAPITISAFFGTRIKLIY